MRRVVVLLLLAGLWFATSLVAQESGYQYLVPKKTTVGELAKEKSTSVVEIKKLNPDLATKLKSKVINSKTVVPQNFLITLPLNNSSLYADDYNIIIGSKYFFNQDMDGMSWGGNANYLYALDRKKKLGISVGAYASFDAVSRSNFKDESYDENGYSWSLGVIGRYKWVSSHISLYSGLGHLHFQGETSSGFKSHYDGIMMTSGLDYHLYGDRQILLNSDGRDLPHWFNDSKFFLRHVFPLKTKEPYFWQTGTNYELFPDHLNFGAEIALLDIKLSQKFLLPLSFEGSMILYDFGSFKTVTEAGLALTLFHKEGRVFKLFGKTQEGSYNVGARRFYVGLNFDFDCFIASPSSR